MEYGASVALAAAAGGGSVIQHSQGDPQAGLESYYGTPR